MADSIIILECDDISIQMGIASNVKVLDSIRDKARVKHLSYKTEKSYVHWAERYIRFHNLHHPSEMGVREAVEVVADESPKTLRTED